MKRLLLLLITFFGLSIYSIVAQNDTLYVMKNGIVVGKYNTNTDIDSIVFYKPSIIKEEPTTVTDVEGNVYKTVKIGNQIWMAENLKTTKYNDGTSIPLITSNITWGANYQNSTTNPMMCYYNNSTENNDTYGALYNFYVVNTKKVCPAGWHVPSDVEWTTLTNFIGAEAGKKLKSKSLWEGNGNGIDSYNFSVLPGGYRRDDGVFQDIAFYAYFLSSTSYGTHYSLGRYLNYNDSNLDRQDHGKGDGYSIRCIKD
jgi:uncharacterized protein (TIGR02145 family)